MRLGDSSFAEPSFLSLLNLPFLRLSKLLFCDLPLYLSWLQ